MEETRSREKTWGGREKPPQAGLPGRVPLGGDKSRAQTMRWDLLPPMASDSAVLKL